MTQLRNHEWQDPIDSLPLNQKFLGIIPVGRHRGLDIVVRTSALKFKLNGSGTQGIDIVDIDETLQNNISKWITPQGVVITETGVTDELDFTVNASGSVRLDIIIGSHEYDETTVGGNPALYSVVLGTPGSGEYPTKPLDTDVIIGRLYVANGVTDITNAIYYPEPAEPFQNDRMLKSLLPTDLYAGVINMSATDKVTLNRTGSYFTLNYVSGTRYIREISHQEKGALIMLTTDADDWLVELSSPSTYGYVWVNGIAGGGEETLRLPANTTHIFRQTNYVETAADSAIWQYLGQLRTVGEDLVLSNQAGETIKVKPTTVGDGSTRIELQFELESVENEFVFWNRLKAKDSGGVDAGKNYIVMQDEASDNWNVVTGSALQDIFVSPDITVNTTTSKMRFKVIGKTMIMQFHMKFDFGVYSEAYLRWMLPKPASPSTIFYKPKNHSTATMYEVPVLYTVSASAAWFFIAAHADHNGAAYHIEFKDTIFPLGILGNTTSGDFEISATAELKGELTIELE